MFVQVTGKCPHCEVRKHQIDTTEKRALEVVGNALAEHVRETHPEPLTRPGMQTDGGAADV